MELLIAVGGLILNCYFEIYIKPNGNKRMLENN